MAKQKQATYKNPLQVQWWLMYGVFILPFLLTFFSENNKPNLTGIVMQDKRPEFNKENWLSGYYQTQTDDYNNDHWCWKEKMVRWNNQLYYSLFNQIRVKDFVAIKDNYVISKYNILSAYGDDFIGDDVIKEKCRKIKVIQDSLKRKGIDLALLILPGKGKLCEEKIPDKYKHKVEHTNYDTYIKYAQLSGLNILDLQSWFLNTLKQKEKNLLFAKFAHHWTNYAECLAIDTIIKYLEKLTNKPYPHIVWNNIEVSDTPRSRDADILKSMNLATNPPFNEKYAYPDFGFESDTLKNTNRTLVVGDSYWYGPVYMGINQYAFAGGQFWYYYNKVVPSPIQGQKVEVWQMDLKQNIESNKVIILAYNDANLPTLSNGFIEDVYLLYTNPAAFAKYWQEKQAMQTYAKQIRETPEYLKKATVFSEENKISMDSAIKYFAKDMQTGKKVF